MENERRKPYLYEAILSFGFLIAIMAASISIYEADPHIPMLVGTLFAALIAVKIGYSWDEIQTSMFDGIYQALQAIIILAIIGVLIGVWLLAGVVPSMIYYGLGILKPSIFLVATVIICSITSLATGTSWGTTGTIGIALMGIAQGLGIPAPIAAGAIISGAYFGDKMSPLSDTTNLAPAVAGTDVFTHVKFMLPSTLISYGITLGIFLFIGFKFSGEGTDFSAIETIRTGIVSSFKISPLLLIPPIAVIVSIAFKVPAIPGITIGIIIGAIEAIIFQGANLGNLLTASFSGFVSETGVEMIDKLLTAGGLQAMMFSISLTIIAMMFGGIMEKTGQLEVIVGALIKRIKSVTGLITATILTCLFSNATMPEQYISIVIPGRMYASAYKERGLHPKTLSNALEASGTLTSALIPWNTCGVFMKGILGVSALQYGKWAFFNYLTPIIVILLSFTGLTVAKLNKDNI
ncbi:Na+/H+ antiporter NhaC [Tissierella pigra]|uniref:Na+/H+ antiporter NhaC n=1 Tax=Tissierella pigra TaxID=2607614 RepID=A0A6N7XWR5_9FIRM|nr:Na+/H+ antiporter NhaC [Tissierella pigra]MBU5427378.1 Na+/H+ antiporter NhaC [Tissierella pigra]MSU00925.1 Na+/H+ antiporter NhaC [Tissierella pigra]